MAVEEALRCITRRAGADLSATSAQYKFVKLNSSGDVILCAATTDIPIGVLQNKPKQNQAATVAIGGVTKCQAGATIAAAALVGTTAAGLAQTAATGQHTIG